MGITSIQDTYGKRDSLGIAVLRLQRQKGLFLNWEIREDQMEEGTSDKSSENYLSSIGSAECHHKVLNNVNGSMPDAVVT